MVVRVPRIPWSEAGVEKEQRWLGKLAPHPPVAIPEPLAMGQPAEGYPWLWSVYCWLDGRNPVPDELADPHSIAVDLAGFIDALHRIEAADGPRAGRGAPLPEREEMTRTGWLAFRIRWTRATLRSTPPR
jgi:aminoglycoside phosphotransferase (APT) family kinase protein